MKLFARGFIFFIFFFLLFSSKAHALQTAEIFSTGIDSGGWDVKSNLYGAPDSVYATAVSSYLSGYVRFTDSLNIPISATITSIVFKIYAAPSGNSGGSNSWNIYLNGTQCSFSPSFSLGNGLRTVTIDATNCTGTHNFTDVVQANKLALNLSTQHVIGYPQIGDTHTMVLDAIGVYATYEMPDTVPVPTPPDIPITLGSVWEWTTATISATQKQGLTDIISVSAGSNHSLSLKSDGTVWAWGNNQYGQLGNGEIGTNSATPIQVKNSDGSGYLTDVKAIAAGTYFSMILKNDGTVWIWGYNSDGIRGTGIGVNDNSNKLLLPTQVKQGFGFPSDIVFIAAGENHSVVLKSDGRVFSWGENTQGQVGIGCLLYNCSFVYYPRQVFSDAISIAAGKMHSLVVKNDGTVWGWGRFSVGQLGSYSNGWQSQQASPIQIPQISGIRSVVAKDYVSMAISDSGEIFEWGSGRWLPYDANPRQIPNLQNMSAIAGGSSYSARATLGAAINDDGIVWMWDMYYLFARPVPGLSNIGAISIGGSVPNLAVVKMSEPTPTTTPTPTPKIPLILIPGIGGSEFKSSETFLSTIQDCGDIRSIPFIYSSIGVVWVDVLMAGTSSCDDYFDVLKFKVDGQTPEYSQIILNDTLFGYKDAIRFFTDNGYELNKTLFIFPYDWRKDVSLTAPLLDQKINDIKTQTESQKVDIIAHSMGGLVARNYISDSSKAQNVRKLFALGTPHLGSVDFLKNLRFGGCLMFELGPFCLSIARSEVKDIIQNMIGGYELAPSQEYFNFYNGQDNSHLFPYRNNSQQLSYDQIKSFLANLNYNTSLFNPSESFHALDNSLANTNGVEITNIAGSGLETLGQIREKSVKNFLGVTSQKKDGFSINGDKTVPLFSASLIDYGNNKSLLGNAKVFYTKQEHGNLVASGSALNLVKNILEGNSYIPDEIYVSPYLFSGTKISVHSPVNIHAYNSAGQHTGPTNDGDFEANIPGSSYDTLDDAKFIFLPDDGIYIIKFEATDQGSFDFKIRKYEDDTLSQETLYKDIPLTKLTKAETQLDTSSLQSPTIHLDEDGNGTIDRDIVFSSNIAGDAVYDEVSPQTNIQLSGTKGNNGWYKSNVLVTLNAADETSGSGILKTEYSLDNGQTINIYSEPFTVSLEKINKLKFRSVDNAGNEEDPKETEIKIDKTAPEAEIFVDQDKQDIVVLGVDNNLTTVSRSENKLTKKKDDAFYLITDEAGNTLKLDVRERENEKHDRFRIYSMQYNNDPVKILASNYFSVTYNGKRQRTNVKEQNFELKREVKIRIQYDAKKNKSTIIIKENKKEKVKEIKNGLVFLQLLTSKGQLTTIY